MKARMLVLSLLVAVSAAPPTATALHIDLIDRLCLGERIPPLFDERIRIPVGCEIVDCCPGCPGSDRLDWRIKFQSKTVKEAELRLEGLDAEALQGLKLSGNVRMDGDRILIGLGRAHIGGLPRGLDGKVVVGSIKPIRDKAPIDVALKAPSSVSGPSGGDNDTATFGELIEVQQYLGGIPVNQSRFVHYLYPCGRPLRPNDRLRVDGISGRAENVVVMMDARTAAGGAGCSNDSVLRTTNILDLGNLLAPAGCSSEISIFARNNAMSFESPVNTWTDARGNLHVTPLAPVLNMPVSVWIANNALAAQAVNDMANANLLYAQNKIGVQFAPTYNNVSGNAAAVATIGNVSCATVAPIQASAFYTPNVLNMYYVNGAFTGGNCARTVPGDANITYLGTTANLATLAHEIGHAFGLRPAAAGGHTEGLPGFGTDNIMQGGGLPTRSHFSLGQAFRMNTHTDMWGGTMLITDGLRPGPGRACPPLTTTSLCPALTLDWVRP